jgi:hypothetical protein
MPLHLQLTTFYTDLPRVQAIYEQGTPFDNFLAIKISEKGSKKISLKNDIEIHCSFFLYTSFKITYPKHQKFKEITCLSMAEFWELKTIV